jgi:hypothetical protein
MLPPNSASGFPSKEAVAALPGARLISPPSFFRMVGAAGGPLQVHPHKDTPTILRKKMYGPPLIRKPPSSVKEPSALMYPASE